MKGGKCAICSGVFHFKCYDFHHVDPSKKDANPSELSRDKMFEEIKKCVLLCKNCHALEHHALNEGISLIPKDAVDSLETF